MASDERVGFCVLYRFRVRPGQESEFEEAWSRLTEAIRDRRGGLGSRLHRAEDGLWLAYAQWPDRATWEAASSRGSPDPEASERMRQAVVEWLEPIPLDPVADLLVPASVRPPSSR